MVLNSCDWIMITITLLLLRRYKEKINGVKCILMACEQLSLKRFKIRPFFILSHKCSQKKKGKELCAFWLSSDSTPFCLAKNFEVWIITLVSTSFPLLQIQVSVLVGVTVLLDVGVLWLQLSQGPFRVCWPFPRAYRAFRHPVSVVPSVYHWD